MQTKDREAFAKCLLAANEFYGKPPMSEAVAELWWRAMAIFDIGAIESAFALHMQDPDRGQFLPKPADLVRIIRGGSKDGALVAWTNVDQAVRNVGVYSTVVFDDPITMRVLQDMGGWIFLCTKDDNAWPFIGNEFVTRYQGYRSRGEVPAYPGKLIGLHDAENSKNGFHAEVGKYVAFVGDARRAQAVLEGGSDKPALTVTRVVDAAKLPPPKDMKLVNSK